MTCYNSSSNVGELFSLSTHHSLSFSCTLTMRRTAIALVLAAARCCEAWLLSSSSSSLRLVARRPSAATLWSTRSGSDTNSAPTVSIQLNPLLDEIQPSKTVEIFSLVKQMEADGISVTSLCVGEPDFLPSSTVLEAIKTAVDAGDTRYTALSGTAELRQAIATDLEKRKHVKYNPATEIIVANGAKQCVYQSILALADANSKVLIPAPYWPSYPEQVRMAGATPIIVETNASNGYLLTADQLRTALQQHGDNTKILILCNPSNPTGGVYSKSQLQQLCDVLITDYPQVVVLADEIYERLTFDNVTHTSVAALPSMRERTVTINGFSKAHAMTGLRLGYAAAPERIAKAMNTIQSQLTSCAGSLSQAAAVAALQQVSEAELQRNVDNLQHKRDYVLSQLAAMPHVKLDVPPAGAFYALPDVSYYCGDNDVEFCVDLLERHKLAVVPGTAFGAPGTIRISYATSMEILQTAMDKLSNFLQERLRDINDTA